jgi:hypothetical protein
MNPALPIVASVNRYRARSVAGALGIVAALATGCGGISGSHSVSPASFFLPGLIHHEVPRPDPENQRPLPVTGPAEKPLPS